MNFSLSRIFSSRQTSRLSPAAEGPSSAKLTPSAPASVGRHKLVAADQGVATSAPWNKATPAHTGGAGRAASGLQHRLSDVQGANITQANGATGSTEGIRPPRSNMAGAQRRTHEMAAAIHAVPVSTANKALSRALGKHDEPAVPGFDLRVVTTLGKQLAVQKLRRDVPASDGPASPSGSVYERMVDADVTALRIRDVMISNGLSPRETEDRMRQGAETMAAGGTVDWVGMIPKQQASAMAVAGNVANDVVLTAVEVTETPEQVRQGMVVRMVSHVLGELRAIDADLARRGAEPAPVKDLGADVTIAGIDAALAEIERMQAPPEVAIPAGRSAQVDEAAIELAREPGTGAEMTQADEALAGMPIEPRPATAMFDDALAELARKTD
jgi:hypothetical protein